MKGLSYITDENNRKTAVIIDLKKHKEILEDFFDYMIASKRKNSTKIPFDKVVSGLRKSGKLKNAI